MLYPLFVHSIGALLYHPTNQTRTNAIMAAAERRKQEQNQMRNAEAPGLPSPSQLHQHSMNIAPSPLDPALPYPGTGRPALDQAHTYPTPPTSASNTLGVDNLASTTPDAAPFNQSWHFLEQHHCHGRTMRSIKAAITLPLLQPPSSNLYNVLSSDRAATNSSSDGLGDFFGQRRQEMIPDLARRVVNAQEQQRQSPRHHRPYSRRKRASTFTVD
jgi:hypothetical protein